MREEWLVKLIADVKVLDTTLMVQSPYKLNLEDGKYEIEIKELKNMKRSDQQNALMWSLVNKICKKLNGNIYDSYDVYCQILEMAGVHYDDVKIKHEALDNFKKLVKHCKVVATRNENGTLYDYCWVFRGISEMDSKEANQLIDTVIEYASKLGIDVDSDYMRSLLNG